MGADSRQQVYFCKQLQTMTRFYYQARHASVVKPDLHPINTVHCDTRATGARLSIRVSVPVAKQKLCEIVQRAREP